MCSRLSVFKDKLSWKSQYILSLDVINVQKERQIHPKRPPDVTSLTSRPTERGNSGACDGCAWSNFIVSHLRCRGAKRKCMVWNVCSGVHISFCVHTVYCTQVTVIGMDLQDEWCNILVGYLIFSQEGFQNGMQNIDLLLTFHVYDCNQFKVGAIIFPCTQLVPSGGDAGPGRTSTELTFSVITSGSNFVR
jgi:hypothetical protein